MPEDGPPITPIVAETSIESNAYDGLVLVAAPHQTVQIAELSSVIKNAFSYDRTLFTDLAILPVPELPAKRLVYAPTGHIDPDYDDVRLFKKAAIRAIQKALRAGIKNPLLILENSSYFDNADLVTLLGVLEALYVPIQVREFDPSKKQPVNQLGVYTNDPEKTRELINLATTLESGRRVACDIGDADPERMSPLRIEEYIRYNFKDTPIKIAVISDRQEITKQYPLFEAVDRAASLIDRHQGRIVFLEYTPPDSSQIKETLFLVGKGVTYDTGGADVKVEGHMAGMSRDKCGAAAVIGFFELLKILQPKHIRVVGGVGLVRNSIGANGYVSDEVITARSRARVRVANTDAEGRMVMADILCKLKEEALTAVNPHLFTIATLTGHAYLAVGEGYSIVLDNGPAYKAGNYLRLQKGGDLIGDIFEVSRIRRDDFDTHRGEAFGDDVKQAGNLPSSKISRGHQGPAAFLILASGLDKHGSQSGRPLKYSHLDIAGSAGDFPRPATGAPVLALAKAYLLE